jgi:hypothetical protein
MDKQVAFKHFIDQRGLASIDVPEWGGPVHYVRVPNVDEWVTITKSMSEAPTEAYWQAFFLLTRKEDGARLWLAHEEKDARMSLDMNIIRRVIDEAGIFDAMSKATIDSGKKP